MVNIEPCFPFFLNIMKSLSKIWWSIRFFFYKRKYCFCSRPVDKISLEYKTGAVCSYCSKII